MAEGQNNAMAGSKIFPGLQGAAAGSVGVPKASGSGLSEESKNVFTELFGKESGPKTGAMMNAVVEQQDKKNVSYFGDKPKESLTLKSLTTHKSHPGSSFLQVAVLAFLVTVGVFLSQNSASFSLFGVNAALRVETFDAQLQDLQAEVRVQKHLAAALLLDEYVSSADEYLYNVTQASSAYTSQNKKEEFLNEAAALKPQVLELLGAIQVKLNENIPSEAIAPAVLVADQLITELQAKKGQVDDQALLQDIQDLGTAKALLQSQDFRTLVSSLVVTEATDADLQAVFDRYNTLNASSNSIISLIKAKRQEWSTVLDEVERVVKSVDPLFGTEFPGNLSVDNIVLNADKTVSISGSTSTSDTTNFTLVSNLIDAFEASDLFQNAGDRTFEKSQGDKVYTGSFRVMMNLITPSSNE